MYTLIYDTLPGIWNIIRKIDDRMGNQQGDFEGTASFTRRDETLYHHESGTLMLAGTKLHASRSYKWIFERPDIVVCHHDNTPFHRFTPDYGIIRVSHLCGEDRYNGQYTFNLPDHWQVTWTVDGPRKNYTSRTTYHR